MTEVRRSKEHHDASLEPPEARTAIGRAMPMRRGEFTRQEPAVAGGPGL